MKTIVVLGMHRSATSLVAKGLANEIYMGDVMIPPSTDNPHGFWENRKFVDLNNEILEAAGGAWDDPPSGAKILSVQPDFDSKIKGLIEGEGKDRDIWGWKDPRTTLTIDLYLPYLVNPHFMCCFRQTNEVVASLIARAKIDENTGEPVLTEGKAIWLVEEYNSRLAFLSRWLGA